MKTYLDGFINPQGSMEWSGNFALNTLYYGEYIEQLQGNSGSQDDETVTPDDVGDGENADEVTMDKELAYSDPTSDMDMDLDVNEDAYLMEDGELDEQGDLAENGNEGKQDEETCLPDEVMEVVHTEVDVNSEKDVQGQDHQENVDMNFTEPKRDTSRHELASQSKVDWQTHICECPDW
ncbi:hypothetical protein JHK82_040418 [Glycine max]|nr:hypothetical protein JHK85_041200 [Glycine max]KAG5111195.1 hypothetical protein JHK82_040418 [Glycine max]KAG5122485.1 hypothetical protein JHK84_040825 [Glycine max]